MEKEEIKNDTQTVVEERIELFLKGQMAPEEATVFRQELKEDEELRMKALSMALLIRGIQRVGKKHDQAIINEVRTAKKTLITSKIRYYITQGLAVAACVCIIFTVYDYHNTKVETEQLAMSYVNSFVPPLPSLDEISRGRGDISNIETEREVLIELTNVFASVTKGDNNKTCLNYLKHKFQLALSNKLNNYTQYLKHIGYYLAITQLKDNDRKAAKETLELLLNEDPDFDEARILLDKIYKINYFWE